jgi:ribonuclease P protein component
MLPALNRLTRMKDFEILFAEGGFCGAAICTVRVWKIDPQKYPRRKYSIRDLKIGFLVSKKVSKRAVDRNRLKTSDARSCSPFVVGE